MSRLNFLTRYGHSESLDPYIGKDNSIVDSPEITPEQYNRHVQTAPIHPDMLPFGHKNEIVTGDVIRTIYHRAKANNHEYDAYRTVMKTLSVNNTPSDVIIDAFSHPEPRVRSIAIVHSLGKMSDRTPHLSKLSHDPVPLVRRHTAIDEDTPKEDLVRLSNDTDEDVREDAMSTLKRMERKQK